MCFGFPSRTTRTTTELETTPWYWFALRQFFGTMFFLTRKSMSGASESATRSAGWPAATARAWSPDAPYDCVKSTPCPAAVPWNELMIFP